MKRGMEPFLVLNRTISSKSVDSQKHSCVGLENQAFLNDFQTRTKIVLNSLHLVVR